MHSTSRWARTLGGAALALVAATACTFVAGSPARAYTPTFTFAGIADWDRDHHQDVVARDGSGRLWLYPGQSVRGYSRQSPVQIGNGWGGYTFADTADWDRDGNADVIARDGNGLLWLYPGVSVRGYSNAQRVQIGHGWGGFTFAGIADWDRDGHQDIVARDSNARLWLYRGQSVRGYSSAPRVQIGHGWGGFAFAGVTDWDRDGHQDVVARDSNALLWLYPGQSVRGYSHAARVQIGHGWGSYTFADTADWDRDGHQDVVARAGDGRLWLYPGQSVRGYSNASRVQIGNGW